LESISLDFLVSTPLQFAAFPFGQCVGYYSLRAPFASKLDWLPLATDIIPIMRLDFFFLFDHLPIDVAIFSFENPVKTHKTKIL
jgi:hypothetical protein